MFHDVRRLSQKKNNNSYCDNAHMIPISNSMNWTQEEFFKNALTATQQASQFTILTLFYSTADAVAHKNHE